MSDKPLNYIGVLSGTSLDGLDIGIFSFDHKNIKVHTKAASIQHFPKRLHQELQELITYGQSSTAAIGLLNYEVSCFVADAILALLDQHALSTQDIGAIGFHGPTVWHDPDDAKLSWQLGSGAHLQAKLGIPVVTDFREQDIAHGGQGAPLAPFFHEWLFAGQTRHAAVANIGGLANITLLGQQVGFDTGPGNTLLDNWIRKNKQQAYDHNGAWAKSGQIIPSLLNASLSDTYFAKHFPKSTGREHFNLAWLENIAFEKIGQPLSHWRAEDVQCTLTELTAITLLKGLELASTATSQLIETLILCGGGAHNLFLKQRLQVLSSKFEALRSLEITTTDSYGLGPDWVEAGLFAYLAEQKICKNPLDGRKITGANKPLTYGVLYE